MKPRLYLWLICLLLGIHSCYWPEKEELPHKTTCTEAGDYDYLEDEWYDSICTTQLCSTYTAIWKELFMQENKMTEAYFEKHISNISSEIWHGYKGAYLHLCFWVQNDWAIAEGCDRLIIYLTGENNDFLDINLPKNQYLSLEELQQAVQHRAYGARIIKAPKTGPLRYESKEEALDVLIQEAQVETMCFVRVYLSPHLGTLTLEAYGRYEGKENACVEGTLDLITGYMDIDDVTCDKIWGH